ncbi:oligoribonuclease, partial [Stutzerimonas balearica]|uniref:oligoribonuclease n=1 Tax=Stutzerimonas balearica TaxID=74829 RepID=UPI0032B0FB43
PQRKRRKSSSSKSKKAQRLRGQPCPSELRWAAERTEDMPEKRPVGIVMGQHGGSGLTQRVRESRIGTAEAEEQTLAFLEQWVPKGKSPICGNSICQDRRFLYRQMPRLEAYFHYRNLDVSTLKELAARWAPQIMEGFKKSSTHLALDDIRDSIAELRHYREHFIKV